MTDWHRPAAYVEKLPSLPVAMRDGDPAWKYVPIRRLAAYIEQSIEHGLQWVLFEPNEEPLWARAREQVEDFLTRLWRDGRLVGSRPQDAFFVTCDRTTMTQDDIDNGRLVLLIGIAPVRPAKFVVFRIGQWAAGTDEDDD